MKFPTIPVAELLKIGEAEVKTGPFGTQLKASDYISEGTPVINVRNIGFGNIREDKLEYIGKETVQRLATHLLRPEDIVFGRKGAVERHVFIQPAQSNWFQGSDCLRLRLSSVRLLPRFVSYYLLTHEHQQWMMGQCSHGATMASLNQDIISRIQLPCPPVGTQRRVASILSAYDDLIENNTRRIAILEEMAMRVYEEWFVHFRFPGHEQVKRVESELGLIPEGWIAEKLGGLIEFKKGKKPALVSNQWSDGLMPHLLIDALRGTDRSEFVASEKMVATAPYDTIMVMDGSGSGDVFIGHEGVIGSTLGRYCVSELSKLSPYWLYLFFVSHLDEIKAKNIGAAIPHANKDYITGMTVPLPTHEISKRFDQIISPIFELVRVMKKRNRNLRSTRDLLLPKLISGELDVCNLSQREESLAA